ncbi:MAG: Rpn family recombination-promoting nuclease/putative transposase [Selenomonadaceae bacterium]|nr:Rpn family recombination-promoting nuclease/putative transposase [Selenomonadaceae bacterium]
MLGLTPEEQREADRLAAERKWESLTLMDNFIFQKTMQSNPDLCRELCEKILGRSIHHITFPETEKTVQLRRDSRSVRLDVYLMDDLDHAIVLEMQTKNREFLPKRVRYYQSLIDLDFLERGQDYETLNESTIVFICSFDPFDNGLPVYTFRNVCAEDAALELGDGTSKIFLNIKTKEKKATDEKEKIDVKAMEDRNKELKPFFDYLCGRPTEDDFVKRLDEAVQKVKSNEKWRLDYVMYDLEMRDREREAVDSALTRAVRNLMQTKNWTAKDAMDALLIPPTKQAVFAPLLA